MGVTLREIRETDLENIMRWRTDPDITRYMNTNPELTLEGQKKWLASIRQNTDVLYWLIQIEGQPAGVINLTGLDNPEGNLGWAYYVGEKRLRSMGTALSLEMSMYDHALAELKRKAVYSDVFTLNKGVIQLHRLCGCEIVEEKKRHDLHADDGRALACGQGQQKIYENRVSRCKEADCPGKKCQQLIYTVRRLNFQ